MARSYLSLLLILNSLLFAQDHLLVTEFVVTPTDGEFVEIHNPTSATVNLSNYYLTDATFAGGNQFYYNIVTGSNAGGGSSNDFHARFPDGAVINPGEFKIIAMNGTGFVTEYGIQPNYELYETDGNIINMWEAFAGSIAGNSTLSNSGEVVILYSWDGNSDLVQDVDYVIWGDKAEAVDKTGVSIDGPDPGADPSTYLNDTPTASQIPVSTGQPHNVDESVQRTDLIEHGETLNGGNGIASHDETSEDLATSFSIGTPNPGTGPGGPTAPSISNVAHSPANPTSSDMVTVSADVIDDGMVIKVKLFSSIDGAVSDSTDMTLISGNTYEATISPQPDGTTVEYFIKATDDEGLTSTSQIFSYTVGGPQITPIANIQANPSAFTTVTIQGIVTLGAGRTTTDWTTAYVQDTSGRGINIFRPNVVDTMLVRGNEVRITGTVDEFNGITEIVDYSAQVISTNNPIPNPLSLMTSQAADSIELEGTYITVGGSIADLFPAGGGTNVVVDDGGGDVTIRVWDDTGIDLSNLSIDDTITVRAVMGLFEGSGQLVPGYQDEIEKITGQPGDGNGTATIDPDSVGLLETVSEAITVQGESPYTLTTVSIQIPDSWQWAGGTGNMQLSGSGFSGAAVDVQDKLITISGAAVTDVDIGTVTINQLTSPSNNELSIFTVRTATDGGILTNIANSPTVRVGAGGALITPIAQIQADPSAFDIVTIEGIVTLGAGRTITTRTDAYVQDNSGRGINIFSFDPPDPLLVRGNRVRITGTVTEFGGVTEITDYTIQLISIGNELPEPRFLSTAAANNLALEGTYISVEGIATSIESFDDASNISVDDGSGGVAVRVWATTSINLGFISEGDSVRITAVMDVFQNSSQLIPGYQNEIIEPGKGSLADGSGEASLSLTAAALNDTLSELSITLLGTTNDTIRTVQIDVPLFWGWTALKAELILSKSGFQSASSRIRLEEGIIRVTIEDASITLSDTGVVTFKNMLTPADSINSVFWIQTTGRNGTLRHIAVSPAVTVGGGNRYWIYDLQTNSANFTGDVTVRGVTTIGAGLLRITSSGGTPLTTAYIQDESGRGINLFRFGVLDTAILFRWNYVEASGSVTEFQLATELEYASLDSLGPVALPDPVNLTNRKVNSPEWDGTLIQTQGVVIDKFSAGGGTSIVISDGDGSTTVRVWDTANLDLSDIEVNKAIFATGVGGVFVANDNDTVFQILSVYEDQIEIDPTYQPSLEDVFVRVEPHPFVPDRGEKIGITYNVGAVNNQATIRIFDLGGRLILTLLSETARIIQRRIEWNGRNELRDLVPLGTYICHLEVVEQDSGDKKTDVAPIVVGTILRK